MKILNYRNPSRIIVLLLSLMPMFCFSQNIAVSGVVKDIAGEPIIGASIVEPGTTNGTLTDLNGNFTIEVPTSGKITISFVGFLSQTINVAGKNRVDVILVENDKQLSEVVVVGYGTQRREAVTGSVASMAGAALREVNTGNVTSALAGRVAGVQLQQTSSQPGADMQIRIRGVRSLSADNAPLVVLDGIPFGGTIGDINPNDIKSVDILKDASATAIYGSRGAGGVIIVTTYKGNMGAKPKITYDAYYGVKTLYHRYPMMNGDELYQLRKDAGMYKDTNGDPQMGSDEVLGTNTDWQKLIFKNAITTNHNVGISGGTDSGSYNVGAGYYKDQALVPGQDYTRISLRASIDQNIGKYLRFGLTTNNNYNITNGQNLGLYNTLSASPLINPYNEDGSLKRVVHSILDNSWTYTRSTVENLGDSYADNQRGFGSYNSLYGEVKVPGVEDLSYRLTLGLDYRTMQRGQFRGIGVFSELPNASSSASLDKNQYYKWSIEHLITYEKTFGKNHLTLNGLYASEQAHYDRSYVNATDIPSDFFQYWNIGRAPSDKIVYDPNDQDYWDRGLQSIMGRVMYDYDSRYMLMASIRWDGSSVLAEGHKWVSYPAFSAGWNIAKENFMESTNAWLDNLKLRIGFGVTSNQSISPYTTLGSLSSRPYNFGTTNKLTGFYVNTTPNPDLKWETTKTWNFGLDFSFLRSRLSGSVEYYDAATSDILQSVNLPQTAGVSSYLANIGKMSNKGVELALNGVIFDNKDGWSWEAGINFYTNRNKITQLASGQERDESNCWFVGYSVNSIYDYQRIGLWQQNDPYLNILEPGGAPGMIKVLYTGDYNVDGTPTRAIGATDRQVLNADPDWQGGFTTRIAYKNWDLNIIGTYQHGGILISTLEASNGYLNMLTGRRNNVKVDYWMPDNTDAKYPKPNVAMSGDNTRYASTMGYFDASYLKVGQITLGYNFDPNDNWFKHIGLSSARLYVTMQNAFVLFSPFNEESGLDPVTNSYGNQNAAVTGSLPYRASSSNQSNSMLTVGTNSPQTRNFLFGLNVSF
jgi:TonB-linked SusC/RagA family outer membrane protein